MAGGRPSPTAPWVALGALLGDWTAVQSADPTPVSDVLPEAAAPFLGLLVAFRADPDCSYYSGQTFRLAGSPGLSFARVMDEPARWLTAASKRAAGLDLRPVLERGAMHRCVTVSPLALRVVHLRRAAPG